MRLLSSLIKFVQLTSLKHGIDESHSLGHALQVLHNVHEIYTASVNQFPYLKDQEPVFYTSAVVHDMIDKKYQDPKIAIKTIDDVLYRKLKPHEIEGIKHIISTMSYSTVKRDGFPNLGKYQMAYHIVREADLLAAYDFDRAIIYHMNKTNGDFLKSYENAFEIFQTRVLRHHEDDLFVTDYAKTKGYDLKFKAHMQIDHWKKIIESYEKYV
jgi:hypothetical protein